MVSMPKNNCSASLLYADFTPLYVVHWCQSLLALATLISCGLNVAYALGKGQKGTIKFHKNVKIVLIGALILYCLHSIAIFANHFYYVILFHLPNNISNINDCIYTLTTWKCVSLRMTAYITVAGFTFTHLAMCIERTIATARIHTYEQFTFKLGIFLLAPIFIIPTIWNLWIFHQEDLFNEKAYCMSSNLSSSRLVIMFCILMGLDFMAVLVEFVLYKINKRQEINKSADYSLRKSFQLKENAISIKLLLPLSASHSLLFTIYLIIYVTLKMIFDNSDGLAYAAAVEVGRLGETLYTLINVTLFLYLRRKLTIQTKIVIIERQVNLSARARIHASQYQKNW